MIRKQIYITQEQQDILEYNRRTTGTPISFSIRQAIDSFFAIPDPEYDKNGVRIPTENPDWMKEVLDK